MKEEFLETHLNYAVVIKADFNKIQEIKEYLAGLKDVDLIYQRLSSDKLYISYPSTEKDDEE